MSILNIYVYDILFTMVFLQHCFECLYCVFLYCAFVRTSSCSLICTFVKVFFSPSHVSYELSVWKCPSYTLSVIGFNGQLYFYSDYLWQYFTAYVQHVLMSLPVLYIEKQCFVTFALHLNYQQRIKRFLKCLPTIL